MGLLGRRDDVHAVVKSAFTKVKEDTSNIFDWLRYFVKRHDEHDIRLQLIEKKMHTQPEVRVVNDDTKVEELREYIQNLHTYIHSMHATYSPLLQKFRRLEKSLAIENSHRDSVGEHIKGFHQRLKLLEGSMHDSSTKSSLLEISQRLKTLESSRVVREETPLTKHIVKRVKKDAKTYIRNVILQLIAREGQISGTQIREMLVEQQQLTSKSSLYRTLSELEEAGIVTAVRRAKEKIFSPKVAEIEQI